jgi:hypothetical protein
MANTVNKAQKFLLDNNCGDLILNDHRTTKPEDRIYASDIMMMFLDSERGQNVDTSERQLTIPDVVQQSEQFICPDCNKPEKEYRDGLCEMCYKWHTS